MSLQLSIILIMLFIIVYVAIINIFSILFRMTGMTKDKSKFQAISLFTAVGFTTAESEIITSDRTRRKIATTCMITGNVFSVIIVSLIVNLISNFSFNNEKSIFITIGIAFAVFFLVILIFHLPPIKTALAKLISKIALRLIRKGKHENDLTLLDNYGDSAIVEIYINNLPALLDGVSVAQSGLKGKYNINVLMLKRKGRSINVTKDTMIQKHDQLVAFGDYAGIKEVFKVKNGGNDEKAVASKNEVELIDNYENAALTKVVVRKLPELMKEKTLSECRLKALYGINVMMVKRQNEIVDVNASTCIKEGDEIIAFGPFNNINYLFLI